jgi:hypothetical protein
MSRGWYACETRSRIAIYKIALVRANVYPVTNTHHHCITTELPAGYHLATGRLPLRRVGAGELKIIAAILEAPVIEKTFTHLGLQARAPPPAPARGSQLPAA